MKRLFASIELPRSVTERFAELDPHLRGVRWLAPEQMHLTLSFLGNVPQDVREKLKTNLAAISWKSFFLPLIGLGTFPAKGWPKIVWIGVGSGHPHLFQLHKRVQEALLATGLEPDLRSFHPHVTLARCRDVSPQNASTVPQNARGLRCRPYPRGIVSTQFERAHPTRLGLHAGTRLLLPAHTLFFGLTFLRSDS